MVASALGPRVLLRRLREVMAEPVTAQKRLDRIAVADRRQHGGGGLLDLCHAAGRRARTLCDRRPEAGSRPSLQAQDRRRSGRHHRRRGAARSISPTRSSIRPSNISRRPARKSTIPSSACRSCAAASSIGVLVVQNRTRRQYSEEEEEALQTTAMVLAEIIASGESQGCGAAPSRPTSRMSAAIICKGDSTGRGLALGHAVLHEPRVIITNLIAENIPDEKRRLEEAIASAAQPCRRRWSRASDTRGGEYSDVLETFRMFAHDRGWVKPAARNGRDRPDRRGRRRAGPERQPGPHDRARPMPICATACTISTISPTGCCAS